MKICFYALRPFDELAYCKQFSKQYGIDFIWTAEYPTPENVRQSSAALRRRLHDTLRYGCRYGGPVCRPWGEISALPFHRL